MHRYRTHTCGQLNEADIKSHVKLAGWIHSKRDHGGLLFIDLRDQFGITQIVIDKNNSVFVTLEHLRVESVVTVSGKVVAEAMKQNKKINTGNIEVLVTEANIISAANILPMQVAGNEFYGDEVRLKNRFLDLRRDKVKNNMILRSDVIGLLGMK